MPGITLQWKQSSTSGGPYANAVGGSGATFSNYATPVLSSTTYYVCEVSCSFGGIPALSNEVAINVINPSVTSTTPAQRCGDGIVTLGATSAPGSTFKLVYIGIGRTTYCHRNIFYNSNYKFHHQLLRFCCSRVKCECRKNNTCFNKCNAIY